MVVGGELLETSKATINRALKQADSIEIINFNKNGNPLVFMLYRFHLYSCKTGKARLDFQDGMLLMKKEKDKK